VQIKWDLASCEACIQKNLNDPKRVPCAKLRGASRDQILLTSWDLVGVPCPFTASWEEVRRAAQRYNGGSMQSRASQELAKIKTRLSSSSNPVDHGYLKGSDGVNNPHSFVLESRRLTVWLRRLPPDKEREFSDWFFVQGLEVAVAQMTLLQKLTASAKLAVPMLPAQGKKLVEELLSSIPILVAVLGALALSPQKYVAFFRAVFYGSGIVTQAKDYLRSFGYWLADAGGATSYRQLKTGAEALAHFMAMAIADLGLAGLERFISFLKTKSANEIDAAAKKGGYDGTEQGGKPKAAAPEGVPVKRLKLPAPGVRKVAAHQVKLLEGEYSGFREISKLDGGIAMVVREPSVGRWMWLARKLKARSKLKGVGSKSLKGKLPRALQPLGGLVALEDIPKDGLKSTGRKWNPEHSGLQHLKGKPIFEVKPGTEIKGIKSDTVWEEFAVVEVARPDTSLTL